ncbi:MAG: PorP/SprF family type IX secretion system membrane protein [Bacteroidales bacterium]|nr:PorP/SprF family type IX secretion system membrane protein [Bacteroidales bacterium]
MKKYIFIILIIFLNISTKAQEMLNYNLYTQNPYLYNPAYTIDKPVVSAFLNSHIQWMGFDGAPETNTFGIHAPITKNMGLGVSIYNQKHGIINNFNARLSYGYRALFSDNHYLQFGTAMGITNDILNISNTVGVDVTDENLSSDYYNMTSFSAGVGVLYYINGFEVQAIMPQVYERNLANFYTIGVLAYNFKPQDATWGLKPSVMARGGNTSPLQFDANIMADWKETVWAQVGYRSNKSMIASVGVNIKGIGIGYAYQANSNPIAVASNGTHEIQLIVNFGEKFFDEKSGKTTVTGRVQTYTEKEPIQTNIVISEDGKEVKTITTDENGYYTMDLKSGKTYDVKIDEDGYKPYNEMLTVAKDETDKSSDFLLISEKTNVNGVVTDKNNKPIGADIKVFEGNNEILTTTSNPSTGAYDMVLEPGKSYSFEVKATDFIDKKEDVKVTDKAENFNHNIVLSALVTEINVQGSITDKKDGSKVPAELVIYKDGSKIDNINTTGDYKVELKTGSSYKLEYKATDYATKEITIDLTGENNNDQTHNVALEKVDDIFDIGNIEFETGTFSLSPKSIITLNELVELMKIYDNITVEIDGHTDDVGSDESNIKLSQNRAKVCANYLLSKNVDPTRIFINSYGESKPIVPNNSPENRAKNRRVELKINE